MNATICEACVGHIIGGVCTGVCPIVYLDYMPPSDEALRTGLSRPAERLLLGVYRNGEPLQVDDENRAIALELAVRGYVDLSGGALLLEEFLPLQIRGLIGNQVA